MAAHDRHRPAPGPAREQAGSEERTNEQRTNEQRDGEQRDAERRDDAFGPESTGGRKPCVRGGRG
jgi:hypothetical protein